MVAWWWLPIVFAAGAVAGWAAAVLVAVASGFRRTERAIAKSNAELEARTNSRCRRTWLLRRP